MTISQLQGIVRFHVAGQEALGKWAQTAIKNALDSTDAPPESLRFQCRIATDAQTNFAQLELANGETLTLSNKARPQFGKNRDGHPFLTVTLIYSGDGQGYRVRWLGPNVPPKMLEVAVKHDKGLAVKPTTIGLDLSKAEVTPSWKVNGKKGPASTRNRADEVRAAEERKAAGKSPKPRAKRHCARVTESDTNHLL